MKEKLPTISGKTLTKILVNKLGYYIRDQKGNHIHLRHPQKQPLTIPNHNTISRGVLREIISHLKIDRKKFIESLKKS